MSKLIVLVGPPASGKSTYARKLSEESENIKIHSSDELRKELFGGLVQSRNKELFEELHRRILCDLEAEFDCVYDATNTSKRNRVAFLKMVPDHHTKECIILETSVEELKKRDFERGFDDAGAEIKEDNPSVGENVIEMFIRRFEMPTLDEGFDKIKIIKEVEK